eukprot:CAMPEP_0201643096 /NCGR_PEP_ID=MMETSP0493-20130528/27564_1 /ASSEMBLY_ACC=CAM_ASM_000838 /TAXON_ID=420259 /ORGANISM="Thalassiosira gravida, Strain GMp14c1" /LENGTH=270 /DNA_ID=CAMNT_0048117443 /DNA_START=374 /DNA_END=1186 /DNA_ORIENTATION=+
MNSIILLLLLIAKTASSLSGGCQACASSGQCNAAYNNGPGQYCGSFYDVSISGNKPCCCPMQATCKVSPTQCMCHISNPQKPTTATTAASSSTNHDSAHHTTTPSQHYAYHETSSSSLFVQLAFILLILCCCVYCYCCRKDELDGGAHHHHTSFSGSYKHTPIAMAVPTTACDPPSENPEYHHSPNYGSTKGGSGDGAGVGTAIASGLGGLAVGTVIGEMIGRNSAQANNAQQLGRSVGNGGDSRGGYDIAGDSGDSEDGGYDIAGDSGD